MALEAFYSNNQSDWSALDGLYISEEYSPPPIAGVVRKAVGVCGECVRGPVNTKIRITDPAYFKACFGERDYTADQTGATIIGKVWQAMLNKPFSDIYVIRAAAAAAVKATLSRSNAVPTAIVRIDAANVGVWGNSATVAIEAATNADANHYNVVISYLGTTHTLQNINTNGANDDNTAAVVAAYWPDVNTRLFTLTKLANGRPINAAATSLASGAEGSIANSDFTATDGPMEQLAADKNLSFVWVAERTNSTLKDKWETLAATTHGKHYGITSDASTTSAADARTDVANYRLKWLTYVRNWPLTQDPALGTNFTVDPVSWLASWFNGTNPNQHMRHKSAIPFLKGIKSLTSTITRATHVADAAAGINTLDLDLSGNVRFASSLTTSITAGETSLPQRRMRTKIEDDLAARLEDYVAEIGTDSARRQVLGLVAAYLQDDKSNENIVEDFERPFFSETAGQRALGIAIITVRVKTLGHWEKLVLKTDIGTGITIGDDSMPEAA